MSGGSLDYFRRREKTDLMPETKLYNGDCLDIMRDIPDRSVDMVLCDLPYGMTKAEWDTPIDLDRLWSAYSRVTKDNSAICLFAVEPFASKLRLSNLKMYKYDWVWVDTPIS